MVEKNIYYLFGYSNESLSNIYKRSGFQYLENSIIDGDVTTTIYRKKNGILIKLNNKSINFDEDFVDASLNLNFISLIKSNYDAVIIRKDYLHDEDKHVTLTGKWKKIVFYTNDICIGVSKINDLFYINLEKPTNLKMEFFNFQLKIDSVACGSDHILILSTMPGRVFSKGLGSRGQLGHGDLEKCDEFREISGLGCVGKNIACGLWHSICLTEAGDVYSWGWNESGQLGVPCFSTLSDLKKYFCDTDVLEETATIHSSPVLVQFPIDDWSILKIDCGSRHTICLNEDGRVFGFGWNGMGQLGLDGNQSFDFPILMDDFVASDIRCTRWGTVLTVSAHPEAELE